MRIGIALPQMGPMAGPDAVRAVAQHVEKIGMDSLWVLDRLLYPVNPKAPYPSGDGSLPLPYRRVMDPVETLAFAAGLTERVALGTSILNLPWYNPVLLARRLTTVDVLSKGRLRVGLGIGWSPDEYEAAGAEWSSRGKRADEAVAAMKAIWTTNPVGFEGSTFKLSESHIDLKPVQKPYPPIYMAAFTPQAMKRTAREANGWFPVGFPLSMIGPTFQQIQAMAQEAGRDPKSLELIVRGNLEFSENAADKRADFTGNIGQIGEDIATAKKIGADELVLDLQFCDLASVDELLERIDQLRKVSR